MKKIITIVVILFASFKSYSQSGRTMCFNDKQFLILWNIAPGRDSMILINQPNVDSINVVLSQHGNDIATLIASNKILLTQMNTLTNANTALAARVTTTEANILTLTNRIAALETKVAGLKVTVTSTATIK